MDDKFLNRVEHFGLWQVVQGSLGLSSSMPSFFYFHLPWIWMNVNIIRFLKDKKPDEITCLTPSHVLTIRARLLLALWRTKNVPSGSPSSLKYDFAISYWLSQNAMPTLFTLLGQLLLKGPPQTTLAPSEVAQSILSLDPYDIRWLPSTLKVTIESA